MYHFRNRDEPNRLTSEEKPKAPSAVSAHEFPNASAGSPYSRPHGVFGGAFPSVGSSVPESFLVHRPTVPPSAVPASPAASIEALAQGFRLLGMTSREARVYLALRESPLGAREATQMAGLHRATGYRVLRRLLERGVISGDGRKPQRYRALDPAILFHRLEQFYRDETEIPGFLAESFGSRELTPSYIPNGGPVPTVRVLVAEGRAVHPALLELSHAKHSLSVVVRPLATPAPFRSSLARTFGRLARNGVRVRVVCDATPADHRFCTIMLREAKGAPNPIHVRHYSPVVSNFFSIDRQRVVRLATLGVPNRKPPVGIAIDDPSGVRALVSRFESLWSEAIPG